MTATDGDEWTLTESEVSELGYLHGHVVFVRERKPHDRCRACGEAWPCVPLRLVRAWMAVHLRAAYELGLDAGDRLGRDLDR